MDYRREIDGLRAVAVIPVILFHAGFETFDGGFIGVDIFFVISGYLITTIILADLERGTFSIVNFYERRARRILPALYLVMLVSLPFAWLWLLPKDLEEFFHSIVAVSIFSSNFLFRIESGYFATAAELKPLLHTWSLAVEEQYYVLFPLFLSALWILRKRWILGGFIVIGMSSFAYAQWSTLNQPTAGFFLLPTRAWELMVGACVAFSTAYGRQHIDFIATNRTVREAFGLIGISSIVYSIVFFDETVPFPSIFTLIPTLGTAIIILFTTAETKLGRVLGNSALVAIGLVSYSAYLWHQPLFAFARHRSPTEPSHELYLGLSLLALLLAHMSWRFVEMPFRKKGVVSRKAVFVFAVTGFVVFVSIGVFGHFANGFDGRRANDGTTLSDLDEKIRVNYGLSSVCEGSLVLSSECSTSNEPTILVWGDSYAMHLVGGIMSSNPFAKIVQMTKSSCGPFFGVAPTSTRYTVSWAKSCLAFNENVRRYLKKSKSIKYVVLSSIFTQYLMKTYELLIDDVVRDQNTELVFEKFIETLKEIEALGIKPIIFSPPPSNGVDIGRCLIKNYYFNENNLELCNFTLSDMPGSMIILHRFLSTIEVQYPVIWLDDYICSDGICSTSFGSTFIYRDGGHLSNEGSAALGLTGNFYALITDDVWRASRQNKHKSERAEADR